MTKSRKRLLIIAIAAFGAAVGIFYSRQLAYAAPQTIPIPNLSVGVGNADNPEQVSVSLQILFLMTVLSLAPSILVMMTSFTRIIVVLSFMRNALSTQQAPPNQVLIGMALFLTFFVMAPTWNQINQNALQPYLSQQITQEEALQRAAEPLRDFMLKQTRDKDLALFVTLSGSERPQNFDDVSTMVLIPAFIISELKTAFQIGFIIYIPFIVIDLIVASSLMSMGMLMLPPMMISLPFKILLFVMVDGWNLLVRSLILSFR